MKKYSYERDINAVVEAILRAKKEKININLLIGAGCSVTAGIPTAKGIVEHIRKEYPCEYRNSPKHDYPNCMAQLTPPERRNLIADYVRNAKINLAHLSIAQLVKNKYVNRILTTNFDNLLLRACSLVGEFPGIYDLTTSNKFRTDLLFDKAILHLHGQHTGFILCNTEKEASEQKKNLNTVFKELKQKSLWIIVGYSGENDGISDLLAEQEIFEHRLYWVGYNNNDPSLKLKETILKEEKYGFYIKGYDADTFFIKLTQRLACFPPKLIEKPFSFLNDKLNELSEYKLKSNSIFFSNEYSIDFPTQEIVNGAINTYEKDEIIMSNLYIKLGQWNKFINLLVNCSKKNTKKIFKQYNNVLMDASKRAEKYIEKHNNYKGDNIEIFKNMIEALKIKAATRDDSEVKEISLLACEKFKELSILKSDNEEILLDWAEELMRVAEYSKVIEEKINYLEKAEEKYKQIYDLNPENIDNLIKWSQLYLKIAEYVDNNLTKLNVNRAIEKIEIAYGVDNKNSGILLEWGSLLIQITKIDDCDVKETLDKAYKKFELAYKLDKENKVVLTYIASSLFEIIDLNIHEDILIKYLEDATNKYKIAYEVSEEKEYILKRWCSSLIDLVDEKESFKIYEDCFMKYIKSVKEYISNIANKEIDDIISDLNSLAFNMIDKNEFKISKQVLELCDLYPNNESLHYATLGLWNFRNKDINDDLAEKIGKQMYEKSIESSQEFNKDIIQALKQKYNYELSRFLYCRKNEYRLALKYSSKAYQLGVIKGYQDISSDVKLLMEELNSIIDESNIAIKEIAADETIKD